MALVFAALLNQGAEVLLTDPHYACYPNFVTAFDGVPVRTPVREEDGFQFDLQAVEANLGPKTKALVLNSPANPTGTVTQPGVPCCRLLQQTMGGHHGTTAFWRQ